MASRPVRILSLCSGIGGIELGLSLALGERAKVVCHVEREAYAASVLVARMADKALDQAPIWDDLATFDGRRWRGAVDLVTAGYPCQPHSVAGKRLGADDDRNLWPEVARIIGEVQPAFAFLENVPGAMRFTYDEVIPDLRGMGYRVEAGLFSAEEVGAPHRRQRLFVLANCKGERFKVVRLRQKHEADADRSGDVADARRGSGQGWAGAPDACGDGETVGDGNSAGHQGGGQAEPSWERLPFPPGPNSDAWTSLPCEAQPAFRRMADGILHELDRDWRERISALGNAVVPVVAAKAFITLTERLGDGRG